MYELWAVVLTGLASLITGGLAGWFTLRQKKQDVGSQLISQLHDLFNRSQNEHEACRRKLAFMERKMIEHERVITRMKATCPRLNGEDCLPVVVD